MNKRKPSHSIAVCILRLFVAGATARSRRAILLIREMCDAMPKGSYKLEVIDIHQLPGLARDGQIVATPTLVRESPLPRQCFIGDMTNVTSLFVDIA